MNAPVAAAGEHPSKAAQTHVPTNPPASTIAQWKEKLAVRTTTQVIAINAFRRLSWNGPSMFSLSVPVKGVPPDAVYQRVAEDFSLRIDFCSAVKASVQLAVAIRFLPKDRASERTLLLRRESSRICVWTF
jgi:hypothetical protein